ALALPTVALRRIRLPPIPPLFPYTPLFRSLGISQDVPGSLVASSVVIAGVWMAAMLAFGAGNPRVIGSGAEIYRGVLLGTVATRSEEHTSELQSRFDLVCRLLLEKNNTYRT